MIHALYIVTLLQQLKPGVAAPEIPFKISNGAVLVRPLISGQGEWMLLDSGSLLSYLAPSEMKRLSPLAAYGVCTLETQLGSADISVIFSSQTQSILARVRENTGLDVRGILGYNALRMMTIGVDFATSRAWVWGPGLAENAVSDFRGRMLGQGKVCDCVSISAQDGLPEIQVKVNGRPLNAVVDLGSTLGALPQPAESWTGKDIVRGSPVAITMANGPSQQRSSIVHSLQIGKATIICAPFFESGGRAPLLIGWGTLATFARVLISFDSGRLFLADIGPQFSGVNAVLAVYGMEIGPDQGLGWTCSDSTRVPRNQVISIDGIPYDLLTEMPAKNWRVHATEVLQILGDFRESSRPRPVLTRQWQDEWKKGMAKWTHSKPLIATSKGSGNPFTDGPGVYLLKSGQQPHRLTPGPNQLSREDMARIVCVGGVTIPESLTDIKISVPVVHDAAWLILHHWAKEDSGTFRATYFKDGRLQELELEQQPVAVPPGSAVEDEGSWSSVPLDNGWTAYFPPGWTPPETGDIVPALPSRNQRSLTPLVLGPDGWRQPG